MEVTQVSAQFIGDNSALNKTIADSQRSVAALQKSVKNLDLAIPTSKMPDIAGQLKKVQQEMGSMESVFAPPQLKGDYFGQMQKSIDPLRESISKAFGNLWTKELEAESKAFGQAFKDAQFGGYISEIKQAAAEVKSLGGELGITYDATKTLTGAGAKGFAVMTKAALAVGAAVGVMVHSVVDLGAGFESQMTRVRAISGATQEEFEALSNRARELGATLPITARDAGSALEVLAQRGTSVGDMLETVDDIINLSISQQYGLAESADAVSAAILDFGMSVDDTERIVDAFNNASNQSALSMSSLGSALTYVAPNAAAVGMSLNETLAAMEALANAGFSGHRIGTGLTDVISSLAAPTSKGADALNKLGVEVMDATGKMRPLKDIMNALRAANMNFTESVEIFGQAGAKYGLVLSQNADKLDSFEKTSYKMSSPRF